MATILRSDSFDFSSSPISTSAVADTFAFKTDLPQYGELKSSPNYNRMEYDRACPVPTPSTAPSSPFYFNHMGSRDSVLSTPSTAYSLDPNDDYDPDDDDCMFPSFENNIPQVQHKEDLRKIDVPEDRRSDESESIATPSEDLPLDQNVYDDHDVQYEPSRHVDYLAHEWKEEDIWSSWRYVVARRNKINNCARLENASWRTWTKAKYDLKTVSPEKLNWLKDCDTTWLYGPLQVDTRKYMSRDRSPPPSRLSTSSSFLHKKPILKKKSPSALILERSRSQQSLLRRAGEIIRAQQSSPLPKRPTIKRGVSDYAYHGYTSNVTPRHSRSRTQLSVDLGLETPTPSECKHVFFSEEVRQVQAIESDAEEEDPHASSVSAMSDDDTTDEDSDMETPLMMAPSPLRRNASSLLDLNKTIAPLPNTKLKDRDKTPEPPEPTPQPPQSILTSWMRPRLNHSSSQETLRPSNPSHNFLLEDDPEILDDLEPLPTWNVPASNGNKTYTLSSSPPQDEYRSPYAPEGDVPSPSSGMRRTPSGMFMPYDENDDEAAMNNTLFGQAMYAVNTFRDIAHVVWNVGWNRK